MYNFENFTINGFDIFDGDTYSLAKTFYGLFGSLPNEKRLKNKFKVAELVDFLTEKYQLKNKPERIRQIIGYKYKVNRMRIPPIPIKKTNVVWLMILKEGFLLEIMDFRLTILTHAGIETQEMEAFEKSLSPFVKKDKKNHPKFYMITSSYGGFSLEGFKINSCKIDVALHYNDDFPAFDRDVTNFLRDKKRHGLVLIHGKSGTGKTTYIRHLIANVKRKFIFLPLHMAESLSNPEMLPFLAEHKNCILIIEDCEKLIVERENGQAHNDIATLLNMSDGLLNDALGIKLICTFNTAFSKIDTALTRKGRMVNRYEFKELSVNKAKLLAEKHSLPYDGLAPITIGDLFNIEKDNNTAGLKEKRIGFGSK